MTFLVTLRAAEPFFADESDTAPLALGNEVCAWLSDGNSRESVIDLTVAAGGSEGMTAARLAAAADRSLC